MLQHSGDSLIRAQDGNYYFFTSKMPENSERVIQNVRSWTATYNGSERNNEHHGINNEEALTRDSKRLNELLSDLTMEDEGQKAELNYEEHLPGATSEMTLLIAKNNLAVDFQIRKVSFDFYYEQISQNLLLKTRKGGQHKSGQTRKTYAQ